MRFKLEQGLIVRYIVIGHRLCGLGLSNGGAGEPQCLMSTDAGEETDDFGDSGDATECAEDVEDPEGIPKTLEAASTSAINLQQTVPALGAFAIL